MADTVIKTVVPAVVGPTELEAGRTYVHDLELDGDENLAVGDRVEIRDGLGGCSPPQSRAALATGGN